MTALDEFFEREFFRLLGKKQRARKKRGPKASRRLEALGFEVERSLARLVDFVETHEVNDLGQLCIFDVDDVLADGENSLEFLLVQPFRVDAALLHAYMLGVTGAGDFWLVSLTPKRGRHEVFLFSHDTGAIELAADSLEALALAAHLTEREAWGQAPASPAERRALLGHVKYSDDLDLAWLRTKSPAKTASPTLGFRERTEDLRSLLNGHRKTVPAAAAKLPADPLPAEALDALLRAFLRGEEETLRALFQRFARSRSGLVRDAVSHLEKLARKGGPATFERREAILLDPARKKAKAELKKREAKRNAARRKEHQAEQAAETAGEKAKELQQAGNQKQAVRYFEKALKLSPKDGELWAAYCYSLHSLERWADMRDAAQQAVTFDDESSYAHQQLACAYFGLKDYDATIRAGRRAIELDAKNAYAMNTLAVALLMKGNREGRSLLEKACRLNKIFREDATADADIQKALAALE